MLPKGLLTIIATSIFILISENQSFGQTYWYKTFGSFRSSFEAIESAGNGNFLIVGYTDDYKGLVMKIRPNGDTIWSKTYGTGSYNAFSSIHATCDGNFLIAGSFDADGIVAKINQNGDTLWTRTYKKFSIYSILISDECNFLLAGSTSAEEAGTDGVVMKIKPDGSPIWSCAYNRKTYNGFQSIKSSGDGNFILTGTTRAHSDTSKYNGWLVKINPDGDTIWSKIYHKNHDSFITAIQSSGDGNFLLTGRVLRPFPNAYEYDGWILKIKPNGDTIWTRTYDQNSDDYFNGIQPTGDNNFIIIGSTSSGGNGNGLLVKIKPNGDTIWTRTVIKNTYSNLQAIKLTCDGNFLVTGSGRISILSIVADQYANKNHPFTYEIPLYGSDRSHFNFTSLKVPSEMSVSVEGIVSWTPKTDSVYVEHAKILVFNDQGRKDTLTFNIFVNYDCKTPIAARTVQAINTSEITVTSIPGHIRFNLPSGAGTLFIYDIKGRIIDKITPARSSTGSSISWPSDQSTRSTIHSGKYFIKTTIGNEQKSKLFVLMK